MEDILVPIFICCVLPVSCVLIVFVARMYSDNKRAKILVKALETCDSESVNRIAETLGRPRMTPRQILQRRLLKGCIFSLIGLVLIITGIVSLIAGSSFDSDPVSVPLLFGGISAAIGVSFLIVYKVSGRQDAGEQAADLESKAEA